MFTVKSARTIAVSCAFQGFFTFFYCEQLFTCGTGVGVHSTVGVPVVWMDSQRALPLKSYGSILP